MQPKEIPAEISNSLRVYHKIANWNRLILFFLGLTAVITSTFVTAYIDKPHFRPGTIQFWSFISTVSIAIITSFGLSVKGNNARSAYRLLMNAILLYQSDLLELKGLIETHAKAEAILGSVDFNWK